MKSGEIFNPKSTGSYEIDLGEIRINVEYERRFEPPERWVSGTEHLYDVDYFKLSVIYNGKTFVGNGHTETEALQNLSTRITVYKELQV